MTEFKQYPTTRWVMPSPSAVAGVGAALALITMIICAALAVIVWSHRLTVGAVVAGGTSLLLMGLSALMTELKWPTLRERNDWDD